MAKPSAEQIRIWIKEMARSDQEAFNSLFRALYPRLVHFSFRYTRSKAVASDIVQDVFVMLWEKRREIDPEQSPKAYLYRSVRNRSLNYLRDHSGETIGLEPMSESRLSLPADEDGPGEEPEELVRLLNGWISDLPKRQREAFELSRFDGLDHEEIAGVMEVSSHTVNNHIVAALYTLRDRYHAYQKELNKEQRL